MAWDAPPNFIFTFIRKDRDVVTVVSDELGTKRTCPSCAARFYDLNKNPIVCPKCDEAFVAEQLLPSKADLPTRAKPVDKPVEEEVKKDEGELEKDPVVVSLEDLEDDDSDVSSWPIGFTFFFCGTLSRPCGKPVITSFARSASG